MLGGDWLKVRRAENIRTIIEKANFFARCQIELEIGNGMKPTLLPPPARMLKRGALAATAGAAGALP
jgi:hypothetical protein